MTASTPASGDAVVQKLDYLRDLFERRLLEDKAKNRAFDELYDQLEFAQKGLVEQYLIPIFSELLLINDRVERDADETDGLARSIGAELIEVLARRGLDEVSHSAGFDPKDHRVIQIVETDDPSLDGKVHSVSRTGYRLGQQLLRPSEVAIHRLVAAIDEGSTDESDAKAPGLNG